MRIIHQIFLIFSVALLAQPMLAQAQTEWDYQTIDYPGGDFEQLFGINDRGDVVGYATDEEGNCLPFVYDSKKATFTDVAPVAGFDCTSVLSISDSGILVGNVRSDGVGSGLILDKEGGATVFNHPEAVGETVARGVNNDGIVTGYADVFMGGGDEQLRAFIYDPEMGTFMDIVPSIQTIAQGINSKGDVVGSAVFVTGPSAFEDPCPELPVNSLLRRYGWLLTADGVLSFFVVNGWQTRARDISDSGAIVGWAADNDPLVRTVGFVTEVDGTQCQSIAIPDSELLSFPGIDLTTAQGIKNSGEVVGNDIEANVSFIATPQ